MTEDKPMNILKVGIDTMPDGLDRLIELHDGGKPITVEMDAEITALLKALKRLAGNMKAIMDVIM